MEKKNFNLSIATLTFVVGAVFVLANTQDITANVIGASGPGATITAVMGIILIIASAGFFVFIINHGDTELERMVRDTKNHEDLTKTDIEDQDLKDKYDQNKEEYQK